MKQIASNYTYSPTTNVVTLTGVNIDADQLLLIVAPGVGRTMYNFASVTGTVSAGADTRVSLNASTAGLTTTSPLVVFYDDQASAQTVTGTVALDPASLIALENITVTVGSSVALAAGSAQIGSVTASISNFPATQTVAGTVTVGGFSSVSIGSGALLAGGTRSGAVEAIPLDPATGYLQTKVESMPSISGTVSATVTVGVVSQGCFGATIQGYDTITGVTFSNCVPVKIFEDATGVIGNVAGTVTVGNSVTIGSLPAISGTVTANNSVLSNVLEYDGNSYFLRIGGRTAVGRTDYPIGVAGTVTIGSSVTIGSLPAISGTVTANASNGSLTTRFGTPTTANVSFATSAVTNANRKYLLIQNVTTGSNVITVGIGFTPTTTQGIQLTAGAGITFESSYIPTGAVYVLSSVTASNFTILEA